MRHHHSFALPSGFIFTLLCLVANPVNVRAAVSSYTNFSSFQSAVGPVSSIQFGEIPLGATPTDEYAGLGVRFLDPNNKTESDPLVYPNDGVGLAGGSEGGLTYIDLFFANPTHTLGVDFPGALRIELFNGGAPVGASTNFGSSGTGFFGGVVSDLPFDRAVLSDWLAGDVYIDNLYLAPIPEPSIWALLFAATGVTSLCHRWRQRSRP